MRAPPGLAGRFRAAEAAEVLRWCGPDFLERYGASFLAHEVDLRALQLCSAQDLQGELGVRTEDLPRLLEAQRALPDESRHHHQSTPPPERAPLSPPADGLMGDVRDTSEPPAKKPRGPCPAGPPSPRPNQASPLPSVGGGHPRMAHAEPLSGPSPTGEEANPPAPCQRPEGQSPQPAAQPDPAPTAFTVMMGGQNRTRPQVGTGMAAGVDPQAGSGRDAYGVLWASSQQAHQKEQAEAQPQMQETARSSGGRGWGRGLVGSNGPARRPPPWKMVPGTDFVVDGFHHCGPWSRHYFLTHFHADHYTGLGKDFSAGVIYCTAETSRLVSIHLRVPSRRLVSLSLNKPHFIAGVRVTLVEANHCPGAVLLVFEVGGHAHVHCGDMRFEPSLLSSPFPVGLGGLRVQRLYLDTTYCDPRYSFPAQAQVLAAVDGIVRWEESRKGPGERILYVCGAYTIGKEKVWLQVFRSLGGKGAIHVDARRRRTLDCLDLVRSLRSLSAPHCSPRTVEAQPTACAPTESAGQGSGGARVEGTPVALLRRTSAAVRLTTDPKCREAAVRVTHMGGLSTSSLKETLSEAQAAGLGFTKVVAFKPTGWAFREPSAGGGQQLLAEKRDSVGLVEKIGGSCTSGARGAVKVFCVPYSEHSSVSELRQMVSGLRPATVIPTVAKSKEHRQELINMLADPNG